MFKSFLTALTYEMVHHVTKHPDFFDAKAAKRLDALDSVRIPKAFKEYMSEVSENDFMSDLPLVVAYAEGRTGTLAKSPFFETFVQFLTGPFAAKLDKLSGDFYVMSDKDRTQVVDALIKGETRVALSLKEIYMHRTPQEMAEVIQDLAKQVSKAPVVVIQTPREMDAELKKDMRAELVEKHPNSFPNFQINRKLIGGLRIFVDGEVTDHSWLSRVLRFTHLTTV